MAPLGDHEFEIIISASHNDSLAWLGDPASLQFSLSGGESKTALHRVGQRWFRPSGATPSTHILKPELKLRRLDDLPLNEHLCQTAARNLGLPAAHTEIADIGGIQTIIIERFDRSDRRSDRRSAWNTASVALGLPESSVLDRSEQLAEEIYSAFEKAVEDLRGEFQDRRTVNTLLRHLHRRSRACRSVRDIIGPELEAASSSKPRD